jgi:2-polyprenyl-3-methyl-5-hydroxy-6-metoxy-1,4-benzoquinol methylase
MQFERQKRMRLLRGDYIKSYELAFMQLRESLGEEFRTAALLAYSHPNKLMSWLFWKRIDTALSLAGDIDGKDVLDFGCGAGVMFRHFRERGCRIVGCDSNTWRLAGELSKKLGTEAELYGDLFGIEGRKFDFIFALDVLEHIEDIDPIIDHFLRLSHGATRVVVSGPTENLLYKAGRMLAGFSDKSDVHVRSIYDIERKFKERGLERIKIRNLYLPFTLFRVSSWGLRSAQ